MLNEVLTMKSCQNMVKPHMNTESKCIEYIFAMICCAYETRRIGRRIACGYLWKEPSFTLVNAQSK